MKTVISGAGIAGLATAHRLATLGHEVVLLEKAPAARTQGYMIDFFGPGYDAAEAMGVLPRLAELGYAVTELRYVDDRGRRRASTRVANFTKSVQGRMLSIMRPDLELALREHLPAEVDLRYGTSLEGVEQGADGVRVRLGNGDTLDADLLIGADGVHSTVRRLVFGEESRYLRYLGFHTAAFIIGNDPGMRATVGDNYCLTDTTGRQMGFYGLRGGRIATFTVHRTADPTLPRDARAAIRREYGTLGWIVPRALEECPPDAEVYYDQVAQVEMSRWSSGRVTLVGDACQAVSLLAGQGASLGIAGGYLLAEQLDRAGSVEAGLAEYERLWRPVIVEKQQVARDGTRWFLPSARWQLAVRRIVIRLAGLPGFDRWLAGQLVGKSTALIRELDATGRRGSVAGTGGAEGRPTG